MPRKKNRVEPEYILRVFHFRHETGKKSVAVVLETVKEFVSFNYEVLLDDHRAEKEVHLKILGLHTPVSIMPGTGPARGVRFYTPLSGNVSFHVKKLDGNEDRFVVNIGRTSVKLVSSPKQPFIRFSNESVPLEA